MMLGILDRCMQKKNIDHLLTPYTGINSKWIRDLNIRLETIKILEGNIRSKILGITHRKFLLDISPQAMETKEKINKWHYIKPKSFCTTKDIISKIKRQLMEWDNIFPDTSAKELISKIYKELTKLNTKTTMQLKKEQKT